MNLTAYFDESGTHDGSHATVMAAVLANEPQWRHFAVEFDKIRRRNGFRIFHATDFRARRGEFSGWSNEKRLALLTSLGRLTNRSFADSVTVPVPTDGFKAEFEAGAKPRKYRLDSAYGLGFRLCLTHLVAETIRRYGTHKNIDRTRLRVVLEDGAKNRGDAARVFQEMKDELQNYGVTLLDRFELAPKKMPSLMMADFLAYTTWAMTGKEHTAAEMIEPHEGSSSSGVVHLEFEPGGLLTMKEHLITQWAERRRGNISLSTAASG